MKRSKFSLSNYKLLTCDLGQLVPCGLMEVLPGDTLQQSSTALIRCSPLLAPVMHPVSVRIHHWFVPNRLITSGNDWEEFITGGNDGLGDGAALPLIGPLVVIQKSLSDYLGMTPSATPQTFSALPVRAYNKVFNEFYADEDLITPVTQDSVTVQRCAWEKDYFTTARPWPARGTDVTVPLVGRARVDRLAESGSPAATAPILYGSSATKLSPTAGGGSPFLDLWAQLDQQGAGAGGVPGIDVEALRLALGVQRFKEARARYGARYTEYLRYLGVTPSDARLERPEYLGGGKQTISFSEVLQTSNDGTNGEVGAMAGHGIAAMRTGRYRRFFEEHGFVISLLSVRPKTMYVEGRHKLWDRPFKESYYQRELEAIGQTPIRASELFGGDASGSPVFGYQDNYAEYRSHPSSIAGEFRTTLNFWHMARSFAVAPTLNASFVNCDPGKRNFAEQSANSLWCMVSHKIAARRMISKNPTPRTF